MSKDDNTIGSWAGKPLPYGELGVPSTDIKENTYTTMGLVKLTQPDYFISYLEETGVVPKGYSKLDASQKEKLGWIIADWLREEEFQSEMRELYKEFLESQTSESEEE